MSSATQGCCVWLCDASKCSDTACIVVEALAMQGCCVWLCDANKFSHTACIEMEALGDICWGHRL